MKFTSDVEGTVTGVRYYKPAAATATHIGRLWAMNQTLLAEVTFTNETASGWQTATFPTPVAIQANTTYIISYHIGSTGNGSFQYTQGFFTSTGVDTPPLHAPQGASLFFEDGQPWFGQSNGNNYWVDLVFSDSAPPVDVTPPTVTAVTPTDGAIGVLTDVNATVTFSEAMDAASINAGTVELRDPSNAVVTAAVAYNASTHIATLDPAAALAVNTTYTARILSGPTGVKDVAGNELASDYTWTFTTVVPGACPCSIWPDPITPGLVVDNVNPIELGLRFRADVAGYVAGVRFFKAAGSVGTHVGRLWTTGGVKLAEVTFSGETASGWQTATFPTPAPIQANTTYIVSYYLPDGNRRFADTQSFFATAGVDNPPLHALRDGVDGANGTFSETGGFFNQSFMSSNYWVDVVFNDGDPPPDNDPPTASANVPANGATGVPVTANASVTFSEAMDPATLDTTTFELRDPGNSLVLASVTYNPGTYVATLDPTSSLAYDTTYTARILGGGAKDLAGNALAADHTWTFTTESPDLAPPTVSAVTPASGATGVLVGANVTVTFNEAMNAGTISAATIVLRDPSDSAVASAVSYDAGTRTATLDPTASLDYSTIYTVVVVSGPAGVTDAAGNPLATDYTATFTTETPDVTPPTLSSVMPIDGVTRLRVQTRATARFSEPMDPASITATTFELRDPSNNPVAATVTYDAATRSATLVPTTPLAMNTTYTAHVKGGAGGVTDAFQNALAVDYTWSFTTIAARPAVDAAPGGPILIIASPANLYTRYLTEIVRTEGLNAFDLADIGDVTPAMLAAHDVVILGDMALSAGQVTLLTDWVTAGGHLIAMRPDKQLAGLLGLTDAATTLSNGYLLIDVSQSPGTGSVGQTLQFHGTADAYALAGATSLATLYSTRDTATPYPAVTIHPVGTNGGIAAAFTFDLARSIVWTHQGNPAWQIGHVNPHQSYGTAVDLFWPDWIDFNRITIPQADEQQRFFAKLILHVNAATKPLPRFWYFPKGKKAAIILTGDDHHGISTPSGRTSQFFERHKAQSPPGCSVEDWECIRSSSYGFATYSTPGLLLTDAQAAAYTAEGFELGIHANAGLATGNGWCDTWPANTASAYTSQLEAFMVTFASIPVQLSERNHCYSYFGYTGPPGWHGYAGIPEVEGDLGIRFDTNISYNPASWATTNPGYQMGTGMMMRFAQVDESGVMTRFLDVYNGGTQMNDDNGQGPAAMRTIVDSFLDNAIGPNGYYGGFVVNMHSDNWYGWSYDGSDQIVASAIARQIPVVSGSQMVDWLDGRNSSSFGAIDWDGTTLTFTVTVGTGARNLTGMVPNRAGAAPLSGLTRDGQSVSFTVEDIKGVSYAFFPAEAGTYAATYAPDTTPPVISAVTANPTAGNGATVSWTTSELATSRVDYGTSPDALTLNVADTALVGSHTITLADLAPTTVYYYRVTSVDESGNTATSPPIGSDAATFTTPSASLIDLTAADFGLGTGDANIWPSMQADGEVMLTPAAGSEFGGSSLPPGWTAAGGTATVAGGAITVTGSTVGPATSFGPGHSLEAVATFRSQQFQHVGFGVTLTGNAGDAWAIISTGSTGTGLLARTWTGTGGFDTQSTPIPGSFLGAPHRYRIDWNEGVIDYYVDGVKVATHNLSITLPMRPLVSQGAAGGPSLEVDWLHVSPYASPGVFTSRVFDAGTPAAWGALSWTADLPGGTTLAMSVRTGDTPIPDGSWSAFTPVANSGGSIGGQSRYVQYQATLAASDTTVTLVLNDVTIFYDQGSLSQTISFAPLADRPLDSGDFQVSATASSGLAVSFSSLTAPVCTVTGTTVSLVSTGTCTIAADQPGNAAYAPATQVTQSFDVTEVPDTTPPVISNVSIVTDIDGSAVISWQTDEPADGRIQILAPVSSEQYDPLIVTGHSFTFTGLTLGETYSYRITAVDAALNAASLPPEGQPPGTFTMPEATIPDVPVVSFPLPLASPVSATDYRKDIGYARLLQELGAAVPTGAGVVASQVETPTQVAGQPAWMPDALDAEFAGKTISDESESSGLDSPYATAVGRNFYGISTSIAPAISTIGVFSAGNWLGGGLMQTIAGSGGPAPQASTSRVTNHSWLGTASDFDANVLRRLDWLVETDESIQVVAVDHGDGSTASNLGLLASAFNAIAVGRSDGQQLLGSADVDDTYTTGRTRPDIVDPADSTLITTAHVSAAAALLVETGHGNANLSADPESVSTINRAGVLVRNAERSEVIKAALMAGADRVTHNSTSADLAGYRASATDMTVNGLDRRYGAGQLNIWNSYQIITAGEQNSSEDEPPGATIASRGYDYDPHFGGGAGSNATASYPLPVQAEASVLQASLVWNLDVAGGTETEFDGTATLHDLNVEVIDLANGNAVIQASASTGENTEHLWVVVPANAQYALRVTRAGSFDWHYALAWLLLPDADEDRAPDEMDNCSSVANPDQLDTDNDGFGNTCDADLNNSGLTTATDFNLLRSVLNQSAESSALAAAADMNGSGLVTTADFNLLRDRLNTAPGPSGLNP